MAEPKKSNLKIILIIVGVILILAGGGYLISRMFFFGSTSENDKIIDDLLSGKTSPTTTSASSSSQKGGKFDQALVGTWTSECLVPDQDSPWSEKHQFVINADGSAVHTRWSSDDHGCGPSGYPGTLTNNYKMTVAKTATSGALGQINLLDTGENATYYDVYQVNGNTLKFGHGFRNDFPYDANGTSEGARIATLNDYIVYSK